jgi:hypothetical protein
VAIRAEHSGGSLVVDPTVDHAVVNGDRALRQQWDVHPASKPGWT